MFANAIERKQRPGELEGRQALHIWHFSEGQCADALRLLPVDRDTFALARR